MLRSSLACSKQFAFDINGPGERQRHVLTLVPVDWAAEWVRPTPPALKFVGPILSAPGKPLPAELEVHLLLTFPYTPSPMGACCGISCSGRNRTSGEAFPPVDLGRAFERECRAFNRICCRHICSERVKCPALLTCLSICQSFERTHRAAAAGLHAECGRAGRASGSTRNGDGVR